MTSLAAVNSFTANDKVNHKNITWLDQDLNLDLPIAGQMCDHQAIIT
jgi:hypothetical protein